jgi:hypothetical protein
MSGLWDTITGLFDSESGETGGGSGIWNSITGLFDSGSSGANTGEEKSWFGGFLGDLFSPESVASGLSALGTSHLASNKNDSAMDQLRLKFEQDKEMSALSQAQNIELLKLKAALGGGGGGGGSNIGQQIDYQKQRDKYEGQLRAREAQILAAQRGSGLTLDAIKNMIDAGQKPLGIR